MKGLGFPRGRIGFVIVFFAVLLIATALCASLSMSVALPFLLVLAPTAYFAFLPSRRIPAASRGARSGLKARSPPPLPSL